MASSSSDGSISCYDEWESSDCPSESSDTSTSSDGGPKGSPSSWGCGLKRKQKAIQKNNLEGRSRHSYSLRKRFDESFKDTDEESPSLEGVCSFVI